MAMKRNQKGSFYGSEALSKEIDPQSRGYTQDYVAIDANAGDDSGNINRGESRDEIEASKVDSIFTDKNVLHSELGMEVLNKNEVDEIMTGKQENVTETLKDDTSHYEVHHQAEEASSTKSSTATPSEAKGENHSISGGGSNLISDTVRERELQNDEFTAEPPDKVSHEMPACEGSTPSLHEIGVPNDHFEGAGHNYKSEVGSESITFNFNSSMPLNKNIALDEDTTKQTADSDTRVACNASYSEGELDSKSNPPSLESKTENGIGEGDLCSTLSQSWRKVDGVSLPQNEVRNKESVSLSSQLLHDEGEASFSASTSSPPPGSIPRSGSLFSPVRC